MQKPEQVTVFSKAAAELFCRSVLWAISLESMAATMRVFGWEAAKPTVQGKAGNKTAIIPIQGVLTKDGPAYYGSNYNSISDAAEQAANDPNIKRVILSVDSPGGEVTGLPETGNVLAQLAKTKPVSAVVEGTSASAAYWLSSQASDITIAPSAELGSVGVRMMHVDVSKMLDNEGFKVTELYSGEFKTEWSPYKPLSEEAVSYMQPRLNSSHQEFINAISNGRGSRVTAEIANQRYGEGRMFSATDAVNHGLADKIQAPRDFYKAIMPQQEEDATREPFGFKRAHAFIDLARLKG